MQNNNNRVAIFDFCETIANFQTADEYVNYTRYHYGTFKMQFWNLLHSFLVKTKIISLLDYFFHNCSINKRLIVKQLSNEPVDKLDKAAKDYYNNRIRPNLIETVVNELVNLKREGFRIMLISGGYDIYLKYFAEEFGIKEEDVVSTKLGFKNGKCTGSFEGKDCLNEEKIVRLNSLFPNRANYYFQAYSDSESDRPMLDWADQGFVVRRKDVRKWDVDNKFKEIVWER